MVRKLAYGRRRSAADLLPCAAIFSPSTARRGVHSYVGSAPDIGRSPADHAYPAVWNARPAYADTAGWTGTVN